jgi:hypothetical protein
MIITLIILLILYIFYHKKFNQLLSNINKIYKCSKVLLVLVPIIILYFNKDMVDKIMKYLGYFDQTGLFQSKKDLSFHLGKINSLVTDKNNNYKNYRNHNGNNNKNHNKRNVSESKKKYIAANQNWKCGDCKQTLNATYEVDHIVPLYKGGSNEMDNLMAMCRNCHGNKTLKDRLN